MAESIINTTGSQTSSYFIGYSINSDSDFLSPSPSSKTTETDLTKNIIIPSIIFFFGVFSNLTALVILFVRPSKVSRSTAFYHLVKALAVNDLTGMVALSPITIVVYSQGGSVLTTGGMALCHFFSVMMLSVATFTLLVVMVMAGERFLVTNLPFYYSQIVTRTRVNIVLMFIILISLFGAFLPVIGFGHNTNPWPGTWCFSDYRSTDIDCYVYNIAYGVFSVLIIIVTVIFNAVVIQHLWHMRKTRLHTKSARSKTRRGTSFEGKQANGPDSEKRMIIFLTVITVEVTVCYIPLMVRVVWNQIWNAGRDIAYGGSDDKLDVWVIRLACLNQLLDPWIYITSHFICCSGPREISQSTTYRSSTQRTRSGTTRQDDQENNDENDSRFQRSRSSMRRIFSVSSDKKKAVGSINSSRNDRSQCSTATASSPLFPTNDRIVAVVTDSSKEPEREEPFKNVETV